MSRESIPAILGVLALSTGVVSFATVMSTTRAVAEDPSTTTVATLAASTVVDAIPDDPIERVLVEMGAAVDYQSSQVPGVPEEVARVLSASGVVLTISELPDAAK